MRPAGRRVASARRRCDRRAAARRRLDLGKPSIGHQTTPSLFFGLLTPAKCILRQAHVNTTTRERIVDEAMHLFSQHGYAATSITKIEAAAGTDTGSGRASTTTSRARKRVLAAGIERQLSRLGALREIRNMLGSLGDLKAELTLTARYVLAELDSESELLRILASDARNRPQLLTAAVEQLVSSTFTGFATWIGERAERTIADEEASGDRRLRARLAALHSAAARCPRHPRPGR